MGGLKTIFLSNFLYTVPPSMQSQPLTIHVCHFPSFTILAHNFAELPAEEAKYCIFWRVVGEGSNSCAQKGVPSLVGESNTFGVIFMR